MMPGGSEKPAEVEWLSGLVFLGGFTTGVLLDYMEGFEDTGKGIMFEELDDDGWDDEATETLEVATESSIELDNSVMSVGAELGLAVTVRIIPVLDDDTEVDTSEGG